MYLLVNNEKMELCHKFKNKHNYHVKEKCLDVLSKNKIIGHFSSIMIFVEFSLSCKKLCS